VATAAAIAIATATTSFSSSIIISIINQPETILGRMAGILDDGGSIVVFFAGTRHVIDSIIPKSIGGSLRHKSFDAH